jgi:hypothetical protein
MGQELSSDLDALRFGIEKSMRYHQRRRGFFEATHRTLMFLVVVVGSSAALDFVHVPVTFAFATAIIAALDLVYSPGMRARDHLVLHQQFSELLMDIVRADSAVSAEQLADWKARRIQLEADEPPIFWALEKDCHNELCRALGRGGANNLYTLSKAERIFMQFFRFDHVTAS